MLGQWPEGNSAVSNVLPALIRWHTVYTQRGEHWECPVRSWQPHMSLLFTADDERQMTVSVMCQSLCYSLNVPPSGRGGKQVEPFCTLIQMAGCNFKSLIVILWHFASPPSESLLIWVMLTEMRIGAIWNSDASLDDRPRTLSLDTRRIISASWLSLKA